jgi:hypothetical protein
MDVMNLNDKKDTEILYCCGSDLHPIRREKDFQG